VTTLLILVLGMAACFIAALVCHTVVYYDWFMVGSMTEDQYDVWYLRARRYLILYHIL